MIMQRTSRLLASAVTALTLLAVSTQAQAVGSPVVVAPRASNEPPPAPPLYEGIQLTKAQHDTLRKISLHYRALVEALNDEDASVRIRVRQGLALREKSRAEMRGLLTLAQQVIYDRNAALQKAEDERLGNELIAKVESRH